MSTQTRYIVTAPLVIAKDEEGRDVYVYRGGTVPSGQSEAWIDQHVADDMIGKDDTLPPADEITDIERPAGNASTEAWHDYALTQGKTEADLEGLSRDEIRDLFPDE